MTEVSRVVTAIVDNDTICAAMLKLKIYLT